MTRFPPPLKYCMDCGAALIRRHYRYHKAAESTQAAVDAVVGVDVKPYCVYEVKGQCRRHKR